MSQPSPFLLSCMEWHVFRIHCPSEYYLDHKNRWKRKQEDNNEILEWCDQHIKGRWTWGGNQGGNLRPIYIEDKNDAMLFKLTWFSDTRKPKFR